VREAEVAQLLFASYLVEKLSNAVVVVAHFAVFHQLPKNKKAALDQAAEVC
jgi:hypothetical protein